jgi:hypothetical protein
VKSRFDFLNLPPQGVKSGQISRLKCLAQADAVDGDALPGFADREIGAGFSGDHGYLMIPLAELGGKPPDTDFNAPDLGMKLFGPEKDFHGGTSVFTFA